MSSCSYGHCDMPLVQLPVCFPALNSTGSAQGAAASPRMRPPVDPNVGLGPGVTMSTDAHTARGDELVAQIKRLLQDRSKVVQALSGLVRQSAQADALTKRDLISRYRHHVRHEKISALSYATKPDVASRGYQKLQQHTAYVSVDQVVGVLQRYEHHLNEATSNMDNLQRKELDDTEKFDITHDRYRAVVLALTKVKDEHDRIFKSKTDRAASFTSTDDERGALMDHMELALRLSLESLLGAEGKLLREEKGKLGAPQRSAGPKPRVISQPDVNGDVNLDDACHSVSCCLANTLQGLYDEGQLQELLGDILDLLPLILLDIGRFITLLGEVLEDVRVETGFLPGSPFFPDQAVSDPLRLNVLAICNNASAAQFLKTLAPAYEATAAGVLELLKKLINEPAEMSQEVAIERARQLGQLCGACEMMAQLGDKVHIVLYRAQDHSRISKISVAAAGREQVPQLPDAQAQVLALESALAPLLGNTPSMLADGLPGLTSLGHVIAAYASRGLQGAPLQPWNLWDWMVAAGAAYMIPGFPGHHVTQFKVLQDAWDAYEFKAGTSST